jgi:hypothetical protein
VKQLLNDEFFAPEEQCGIRINIQNRETDLVDTNTEVSLEYLLYYQFEDLFLGAHATLCGR